MEVARSLLRLGAACQHQQSAVSRLLLRVGDAYIVRSFISSGPSPCFVIQETQGRTSRTRSPLHSTLCSRVRLHHSWPRFDISDRSPLAAQAARTPPFLQRGQRQGQGFQHLNPYSTTSSSLPPAAQLHHTNTPCNPSTSHLTMADDRNILPDYFKAAHYDLSLTDLDFTSWTFNGLVTYAVVPLLNTPSQS